ncbi:MAG: DUF4350 domain-containing protein [Bdellovibrionota bacterium]
MKEKRFVVLILVVVSVAAGAFFSVDSRQGSASQYLGMIHLFIGALIASFILMIAAKRVRGRAVLLSATDSVWKQLCRYSPLFVTLTILIVGTILCSRWIEVELDLSEGTQYSLSPGTKRLLTELTAPIELYQVDLGETTAVRADTRILERFSEGSKLLSLRKIDPVYDIELIERLNITPGVRVVIAKEGSPSLRLKEVSEKIVAAAITRMNQSKPLHVHFSVGHGELDLRSIAPEGGVRLAQLLEEEGATVTPHVLSEGALASDGNALLMLLSPQKPFTGEEERYLEEFVDQGGSILGTFEGGQNLPRVFQREGLQILPSSAVRVLKTPAGEQQYSADIPVRLYPRHPITSFLSGEASLLLSRAYPLVLSGPRSARAKERKSVLRYQTTGELSNRGSSLELGVYCSLQNGARLQLYGDGSWLTNQFIDQAFNRELVRGAVLWGGGIITEEVLGSASLSSTTTSTSSTVMTDEMRRIVIWLFIFMIESLMLTGIFVLWSRRRNAVRSYRKHSISKSSAI